MSETLTSRQRAHLRRLAHGLKPVVHVGHEGWAAAANAIEEAFNTRELLKVKVLESAPTDTKETAREIAAALEGVHVAQTIGRTIVLFRAHPEDPEIRLPA